MVLPSHPYLLKETHQYSSYGGGYQSGSTTKKIDIPNGRYATWEFTRLVSAFLQLIQGCMKCSFFALLT